MTKFVVRQMVEVVRENEREIKAAPKPRHAAMQALSARGFKFCRNVSADEVWQAINIVLGQP